MRFSILFICAVSAGATGCSLKEKVREVKYSAYETIGIEKRDLFKREVADVKESQEESSESFKDALDRLQSIYKIDGGKIEREYRRLESDYEEAEKRAKTVSADVKQVEVVASDLFAEWQKEIDQISTPALRERSKTSLRDTKAKYGDFHTSLKRAESKIPPVLTKLRDHVLYMKHNLNAEAISGLKNESVKIQNEIKALIDDMNKSISQADQFMKTMR